MFENLKNFSPKEIEEEVLKFWQENKIFEKSVQKNTPRGEYVFYDGPPFATGLPHYGHILASAIKDAVPRYWTMKGYRVERKWGWDCHGLPIENIAEKELGIKRKKEIEQMGVAKFNEFCRSKVLDYVEDWKKVIARLGRWADMENSYKTMDLSFMESVWWVFKELWNKGLIYEGHRSMHICTRCETTLSQQEVAEGYKDIKDLSATVKFEIAQPITDPDFFGAGNQRPTTYILAWTTTPWTLIGNAALAINPEVIYCKIKNVKIKNQNDNVKLKNEEQYILAKDRIGAILKDSRFEVIDEFKGKDLVGLKYEPPFDYYFKKGIQNEENGWKIYAGDFVTTEEGTGVVHIAPAFGEDDFKLMEKYNLPFIQHIGMDGIIKNEAADFAGLHVKPMDDHQKTDVEVIKYLANKNLLFAKEKYEHSYPHCWRCETPLINYATSSWFVNILKVKKRALELAKNINWAPAHIKEGRFGNWLEGARDWSISRQRYWASVIPVWRCEKCGVLKVIGSIDELKEGAKKSGNNYFAMRHSEAEGNAKGIAKTDLEKDDNHLTKKGKNEAVAGAKDLLRKLKNKKIDLIFSSEFARAKETAEIVASQFGFSKSKIIYDKRINEIEAGIFEEKSWDDYHGYFSSDEERFYKIPPGGENLKQVKNRMTEFLYDIEKKYSGKNILIISHECPIWLLFSGSKGENMQETLQRDGKVGFVKTAEIIKLDFIPLPHNPDYELDLHKPYIDEVEVYCDCGGNMKRVSDVLDTWFDSGSMPYAQMHYPFENKENFDKNFPAEFIGEGADQTRAWFYYLHILATALKDSHAFKNVIVNGIVLAEDGKKMSKRLKNYPDPMDVISKYGADALRLYLLSSPVVKAESLNFSEKGVDEVYKKNISRLWNVLSFYKLYSDNLNPKTLILKPKNVLDKWILARLKQLISEVSDAMDNYELDRATRPFENFIDDLSTWYLRRSRERFKAEEKDKEAAKLTTYFVLLETSKLLAPFAPFIAEAVYQQLTPQESKLLIGQSTNDQQRKLESVHLEDFPIKEKITKEEEELLENMAEIRRIVSLALEERARARIKVRQPLAALKIQNQKSKSKNNAELLEILKDEINVKDIIFNPQIQNEVEMDAEITPELKNEGILRELTRAVQGLRKKAGLQPKDRIGLFAEAGGEIKEILEKNKKYFQKNVGATSLRFEKSENVDIGEEVKIDSEKIWLGIRKN